MSKTIRKVSVGETVPVRGDITVKKYKNKYPHEFWAIISPDDYPELTETVEARDKEELEYLIEREILRMYRTVVVSEKYRFE